VVKRRTATAKDSLNPTFNAQFDFDIHYTSLPMHKLIFVVKDDINYGLVREPPVLGYVEIDLKDYDSSEPITKWVDLVTL
jgi:hypothetical protein